MIVAARLLQADRAISPHSDYERITQFPVYGLNSSELLPGLVNCFYSTPPMWYELLLLYFCLFDAISTTFAPAKKVYILADSTNVIKFPEWIHKDFSNRISVALEEADYLMLVRRRILYLLRTTWFLEDQFTERPEQCISHQRYPYEMAAVLGLIDWNESKQFMTATKLDVLQCQRKESIASSLAELTSQSWDDVAVAQRFMSMHAFELLAMKVLYVDYIPLGMALLPLTKQTFIRLGECSQYLFGMIQPTEVYPEISLNSTFNLTILNLEVGHFNAPFDRKHTKIELKDISLDHLVLRKYHEDDVEKCCQASILKFFDDISEKHSLSLEDKVTLICGNSDGKLALETFQGNNLRLNLTPLSIQATHYCRSNVPKMTIQDAARYQFQFEFKEPAEVSMENCVNENSLSSELDKIVNDKLKKLIYRNLPHLYDQTVDKIQLEKNLIDRLKYLSATIRELEDSKSAKELAQFAWGLSAILGLIEWEDAIKEWRDSFVKLKESGKCKPIAKSYANWFGESLFDKLVEGSPDGLQGASEKMQIETLIFHTFYVLDRTKDDRETRIMMESLKILVSMNTALLLVDDPVVQNLLYLLPENRTFWMVRATSNHATSLSIIPYIDSKDQQKLYDLRIFNTGEDNSLHEIRGNRTRFAEYKKVPFAFLSLESISFHFLFLDPVAISKGSNMTTLTWLLYPDDIFRTMSSDLSAENRNDFYKNQEHGTCAARSLMALLKSELGYEDYKLWKSMIGISKIETFDDSVFKSKDIGRVGAMNELMGLVPEYLQNKIIKYAERNILEDPFIKSLQHSLTGSSERRKSKLSDKASIVLVGECPYDFKSSINGSFFKVKNNKDSLYNLRLGKSEDGLGFRLYLEQLSKDGTLSFSINRSDSKVIVEHSTEAIVTYGDLITVEYESPSVEKAFCIFRISKSINEH